MDCITVFCKFNPLHLLDKTNTCPLQPCLGIEPTKSNIILFSCNWLSRITVLTRSQLSQSNLITFFEKINYSQMAIKCVSKLNLNYSRTNYSIFVPHLAFTANIWYCLMIFVFLCNWNKSYHYRNICTIFASYVRFVDSFNKLAKIMIFLYWSALKTV